MDTRKNQATLSPGEKQAFVNALLGLKKQPSQFYPPTASRYDDYVALHLNSMFGMTSVYPGWAHQGPAFLPWHRYYIRHLELDLKAIDSSVGLPYWDWTADRSADPSVPGSPWTDDFMGANGDPNDHHVATGPFAGSRGQWKLVLFSDPEGEPHDPSLKRNFGTFPKADQLPTQEQVADCLKEKPYYVSFWRAFKDLMPPEGYKRVAVRPSFCNRLEGWYGSGSIHNRVHLWVGGGDGKDASTSGSMFFMSSPNDPVFFLHHANIDRLWATWQAEHPTEKYHPTGQGEEIGPLGHNLNDPMAPWGGDVTPRSVLDHYALGYTYDKLVAPVAKLPVSPEREKIQLALPGERERRAWRRTFDLSEEDYEFEAHG
jgi:tyrosinase